MTHILGALCTGIAVMGGGLVGSDHVALGFTLIAVGSGGLGLLFAHAQNSIVARAYRGTDLTVRRLDDYLEYDVSKTRSWDDVFDMPIYLATPELMPAGGLFTCRIDGREALVVERGVTDETRA